MTAEQLAKIAPKVGRTRVNPSSKIGKAGWKQVFLGALAKIPNVTFACRTAHVSSPTVYKHRELDQVFREGWERSLIAGIERLEQASYERATDGVPRGVWMKDQKGKIKKVETIRDYSDTLAIFLLKAHKPDKYRETFKTELSGPDGGPIAIATENLVKIVWPHETAVKSNGNGHETIEVEAAAQIDDSHPA